MISEFNEVRYVKLKKNIVLISMFNNEFFSFRGVGKCVFVLLIFIIFFRFEGRLVNICLF